MTMDLKWFWNLHECQKALKSLVLAMMKHDEAVSNGQVGCNQVLKLVFLLHHLQIVFPLHVTLLGRVPFEAP